MAGLLRRGTPVAVIIVLASTDAQAVNTPVAFKMGTFTRSAVTCLTPAACSTAGAGSTQLTTVVTHNLNATPKALILWAVNPTDSRIFMGVSDGPAGTDRAFCTAEKSGQTTSSAGRAMDDEVFSECDDTGSIFVRAGLTAWSNTDFTLSYLENTAAAAQNINYLIIGGALALAKVFDWNMPTAANANFAVTGGSFTPTVLIHLNVGAGFASPQGTAFPIENGNNFAFGLGVASKPAATITQWADFMVEEDNRVLAVGNPTKAARGYVTAGSIMIVGTQVTSGVVVTQANLVSMNSDGFTMNFTTKDTNATRVITLALQGMNSEAGSFAKATATGNQAVSLGGSPTGFAPDAVLLSSVSDAMPAVAPPSALNAGDARHYFGAFTSADQYSWELLSVNGRTNTTVTGTTSSTARSFSTQLDATKTAPPGADSTATGSFGTTSFNLNWASPQNDTGTQTILYLALGNPSPTHIKLDEFAAYRNGEGQLNLRWRTGFEVDNLGFFLYRDGVGARTLLTPEMFAGSALLAGPRTALSAGRDYVYQVAAAEPGSRYWLEEVAVTGKRTWHGPVTPQAAPFPPDPSLFAAPLPTDLPGAAELARPGNPAPDLSLVLVRPRVPDGGRQATQRLLASQPGIKIPITRDGVYRVTMKDLVAAGLDPAATPALLRLYADGEEVSLAERGDAIEFYATGADTPYSGEHVYWLAPGDEGGRRIPIVREPAGETVASSFPFVAAYQERTVYVAALHNGEADNFFGSSVTAAPIARTLGVHHLVGGGQAELRVALQGVSLADHQVSVALNGVPLTSVAFRAQDQGLVAMPLTVGPGGLVEGDNVVTLVSASADDVSLLDSLRLTWDHALHADAGALRFTVAGGQSATVAGFATTAVRAFDVTNPAHPRELAAEVTAHEGEVAATVVASGGGTRVLLLVDPSRIETSLPLVANAPSAWTRAENAADLVIIAHRSLIPSLEPLVALRQSEGRQVAVIDVEDLYDELSFGQKSPRAIKDFLLRARASWTKAPRFVLLVGDATLDPRNYLGKNQPDLVPTRMVDTSLLETASDDWFADFSGTGIPEMAVGRLPARTPAEAEIMVGKIVAAARQGRLGGQHDVLIVAGQDDYQDDFGSAGEEIRATISPPFKATALLRSSLDAAAFKQALIKALDAGPLLVDYQGHGSQNSWRGSLDSSEAATLKNTERPSVFVAMTCLNGFFHDVWSSSLAEALISAPGGAAAVWASSGLTDLSSQRAANQAFVAAALTRGVTLGEAAMTAKAATSDEDIRRTWILFGDPTITLLPASQAEPGPSPGPGIMAGAGCAACAVAVAPAPGAPWLMAAAALVVLRRRRPRQVVHQTRATASRMALVRRCRQRQ
jgi:MYXO-CTERM domain-containing protein